MRNSIYSLAISICVVFCIAADNHPPAEWISLFDGKTLDQLESG